MFPCARKISLPACCGVILRPQRSQNFLAQTFLRSPKLVRRLVGMSTIGGGAKSFALRDCKVRSGAGVSAVVAVGAALPAFDVGIEVTAPSKDLYSVI